MTIAPLCRSLRLQTASWLLLALVSTFAPATVVAQGSNKASQFYEDAQARYEKKDYPGAIIQLKNALKIDSQQLPVQLLLGKALMETGDVGAAEVAFKEALRLGVNRAEIVVPLARAMVAQGKRREVLEQATFQVAGLPPGLQVQMHLLRAGAHADSGSQRAALQSIDDARAIDNRRPDVWLAEVPIRVRARQFKEAADAADKALALSPASTEAQYVRGSIQHVQGDLPGALAAYDRVLQLAPADTETRVARIGIYLDLGRFDDAAKDIAELQRQSPREPRGAYLRALLAERNGNPTESAAALKEVTNLLDPAPLDFLRARPQLLMLNGLAHFGLNQREKAKQYLEEFQKLQGNSAAAKLLARVYMDDGNAAMAISTLETYLRAQPGDGQALTQLANAHMAQGRPARATALMQEALKTQDNPAFRSAMGLSLVSGGDPEAGMVQLETAFRKDPRQTQAGTALAQLYLRQGQWRKAIPVAESLIKVQASSPGAYNLLGMAQAQGGNAGAARASFEKALALSAGFSPAKINLARLERATNALDAATTRLQDILKTEPNHVEAMYELALVHDRKGQVAEALRLLERARDQAASKDLRWGLALVDFHLRRGNPTAALDAAKVASAKAPEDLATLMAYSRAQLANGDRAAARTTLSAATRYAEFNPGPQLDIARLQLSANNFEGAAYSLGKALSTKSDFLPAQVLLVEVELRSGQLPNAEKRAREIIVQHPKAAVGHSALGDVLMVRGQQTDAIDSYRRAHQTEPSAASLLKLFTALSAQDAGKPAIQLAEQWLRQRPQDLPVHKALGNLQASNGNFTAARKAFEAAQKLSPNDAEVLNNLANVQLRLNDPAAVATAEAALKLVPGNPVVGDTLGWALFKNGQAERALQQLRDARLRMPDNAEIRYHLAAVLAHTGRANEARAELEAALNAGVDFDGLADARKLMASLR